MSRIICFLLLSGVLVNAGTPGTKWINCKTLGSEKCFYTQLESITTEIGNPGTNDDVKIEICSDFEKTDCCTTPALKGSFSDDWSTGDTETWGSSYFGKCKSKKYLIKKALIVTLSKNGKGPLNVTAITIDTIAAEKKSKEPERFKCKAFYLGGTNIKQTQICPTGPYEFLKFKNATIKIGPDGTDDSVKLKICSDANDVCCEHKLSHKLKDDWHVNKTETWKAKSLGDCGKKLYKINNKPIISVSKNGKDDLNVDNVEITMITNDDKPKSIEYGCGGFKLQGNCKTQSLCRHTFSCKDRNMKSGSSQQPSKSPNSNPSSSSAGGNKPSFSSVLQGSRNNGTKLPPGIPSGFQKLNKPFRSSSG